MKVLHIISGGETGGSKAHVLSLLEGLSSYISATAVCFLEGDFYRLGREMGLDVRLLRQEKRYNLAVLGKLRELVEKEGFDLLHCHGPRSNFLGALLMRSLKIPALTTVHSDYKLDFKGSRYKSLVYSLLNVRALKRFPYYIAVSDSFKEMLVSRGFPAENIYVVYNGIDFKAPLNETPREEFLARLGLDIPQGADIVGFMSRLHPVKGHDVFLRGAGIVLEEMPDTYFLIAGEGEGERKIREMRSSMGLEDRVFLTGYINSPEDFMNAVDINTLTSYSESFPLVLLEGARWEKPTVSADVGGIRSLIREGETGLLFPPGSSEHFASQLLLLLRSGELARFLGENLYRHARDNFSLERLVEEHLGIYKNILKQA